MSLGALKSKLVRKDMVPFVQPSATAAAHPGLTLFYHSPLLVLHLPDPSALN
jgi:hypothetical protein